MKKIKVSIIGPGLEPVVHVSKAGLIIKIVVGIVGVAVIGTGVALVARIWDPLWNPFRPEPEEVIEEMFVKMKEVEAMHSEIKIEIKSVDEKLKQETQLSVVISGDSDAVDSESAGEVDIIMDSGGIQISLAGEYKITDGVFFIKLDKIPALLPIPMDLSMLKGQWIKLSEESDKEKESIRERIIKWFEEEKIYSVYSIKEELPDEKINGLEAYHYLLVINQEDIIRESIEESFGMAGVDLFERSLVGDLSFTETPKEMAAKFAEAIGEIEIEVWIGKKDNLLYRVKLNKEIDAADLNETAKGKITVDIDIEFSNFNEPIEITAPKESKTLEEILNLMFSISNMFNTPIPNF